MTSVFAAVSFIETVSGASILTGVAMYRLDYNEFVRYNYKAFSSTENQHMINKIQQNTTMLIIGRFVLENSQLNVTVTQAILLELKMIEGQLTAYDLPTCPPFGAYSAPCKSSEFNKNSTSFFTLERRAYNPLTSHYITSEIACSYNAGNSRHIGVPKAIETKAIMSVSGELYKGNNMIQILTSEIEWNYAQQSGRNTISLLENVSSKKRNQHLMNYENRYQNKKPNLQQTKVTIDENEDHREEKDLSKESGDKTQNEAEENINSKTNLLKSTIKKTMKK